MSRKPQSVYGVAIAPPRLTYRAIWLGVVYVGLPILGVAALLDALVGLAGR